MVQHNAGEWIRLQRPTWQCKSKDVQVMWFGGRYALTPDVDIAAGYYHYNQNDFYVATATLNCSIPTRIHNAPERSILSAH